MLLAESASACGRASCADQQEIHLPGLCGQLNMVQGALLGRCWLRNHVQGWWSFNVPSFLSFPSFFFPDLYCFVVIPAAAGNSGHSHVRQ
jgi:hypothetical protein